MGITIRARGGPADDTPRPKRENGWNLELETRWKFCNPALGMGWGLRHLHFCRSTVENGVMGTGGEHSLTPFAEILGTL